MARQKGSELLSGRNLAIIGNGLVVAVAAGLGYSQWQRARAERPDLQLAWNYRPFDQVRPRQTADVSDFAGKKFRHHLAVLTVDGHMFDDHLSRSDGTPALAVRGSDDKWYAGVVPQGEFGETGHPNLPLRAVAIRLGSPTLTEVQLGIMDEEQYVPFDTEALGISGVRDIRRDYPDVPLLELPPITFGMPGRVPEYPPIS